jgi:hypothetical protein
MSPQSELPGAVRADGYRMNAYFLTVILLTFATSFGVPQDTKVSMRTLPRANETMRFRMIQEMDMDITAVDSAEGEPDGAPPSTTRVLGKTTFAFTQKTGSADKQGNLPVDVTYEQITVERSMNGVPSGDGLGRDLVGRTVRMTYDKNGKVVDVKVPADLAISADALRETMSSLLGNLPQSPLAVGESARVPFSAPLPVPTPAGDNLTMTGEMHYTLRSVAREGKDRMASYDQTLEAKLDTVSELALPSGPGKVHITFKLTGSGGLVLNIDKGVVTSGEVRSVIEGNMYMTPAGSQAKLHSLTLHGTTKTSAAEIR